VLENFKRSGLAKRTKLILIPPAHEGYNWVSLLRQHGNIYYARDVALFEKAVKAALR
jgi:predicted metallopeptidase